MNYRIFPPKEMIETEVALPLSKSLSNRALIMNALTLGAPALTQVAQCDDTDVMVKALANRDTTEINIGAAGTAMRFLTAYYAAIPGRTVVIDGSERMRQRPIGPLVEALRSIGASVEYVEKEGFPPLRITGARLKGGEITMPANISSQFLSAILMIAPLTMTGLTLHLDGEITSLPYLKMTLTMMRERGIDCELQGDTITVTAGEYQPCATPIEADWSAASYWYQIAAMSSGWVELDGLQPNSLQGDSRLVSIFEKLGILTELADGKASLQPSPEQSPRLELDLSEQPDIVQTLAVTCCCLTIPFRFWGLHTLRIKETDRLEALRVELLKLGMIVTIEGDDCMWWEGQFTQINKVPEFDTYNDHRMAMAFAPISLFVPGIVIRDAEVVSKSYPQYWQHLANAGFMIAYADEQSKPTVQE